MIRKMLFRLSAILIAVAATLLVVEAVLQITSEVFRRAGPNRSRAAIEGEFRIACIGESTTGGMWPGQLEEILNEGRTERNIRVINRGLVGIRTDRVAREIEQWLDQDRPHLVITMLGINDEGNVLVYPRGGTRGWLTKHSRTARLLALLWRSAFQIGAPKETDDRGPNAYGHLDNETRSKIAYLEGIRPDAMRRFRISEIIDIERELIVTDPGTPVYHLGFFNAMVMHHDRPDRLDEFFSNEVGVAPSELDYEERLKEIALWGEGAGDHFAAVRLATSVANAQNDSESELRYLEAASDDPEIAGLVWLRIADFGFRAYRPELVRQSLLNADLALPDDYQWSLLLGDVSFMLQVHDLAAENFRRALPLRPEHLPNHELVWLGRLANACEQAGDVALAADYRAQRDELELGRFREFTRYNYQRVVAAVRAREIPLVAMQYPLLSVESLRKLLDYREDVTYLENRINFESALVEMDYRRLFTDNFAGSFGHLSRDGNMLVAENVAATLAEIMPEFGLPEREHLSAGDESP